MNEIHPLLRLPPDPSIPTVASDLDGTISSGVTIKAIHEYLNQNGRRGRSMALFGSRMLGYSVRKALRKDLRNYKNEWMRDVIRIFTGMPMHEVRRMTDWVVANEIWKKHRGTVVAELNAHLAAGRRVVVVTGMFTPMLESLLAYLPGAEAIGTLVLGDGPVFSGELGTFNVGRRKAESLLPFAGENGRIYAAYGDTYSDLAMLEMSEHPAAVMPDDRLRQQAEARGWRILDA